MPRAPSLKQCLASGYAHVESANFWAALGDRAEEKSALLLARDCFRQPLALDLPNSDKAAPLLAQVDVRLRELRRERVEENRKAGAFSSTQLQQNHLL